MIDPHQYAENNPIASMVQNLIEAMTILDGAITTVESCAESIIDDAVPGTEQTLEMESSSHNYRIIMKAIVRCDVIYIGSFRLHHVNSNVVPLRRSISY